MAKLQQGCAGAEQMTTQRWIGAIVGIAVFIAAFGVALAVTWYQGSQDVPAAVSVHSTVVISGDNLGLWHDSAGTQAVASLGYVGRRLPPPLKGSFPAEATVYIENRSIYSMTFVEPCGPVESPPGTAIGHVNADLFDIGTGRHLGDVCKALDGPAIAPGEMMRADVRISLESGITPGDHAFTTVFGALGTTGDTPAAPGHVAGDINGDGIPDFIVGASEANPFGAAGPGSAYIYSGADGAFLYKVTRDTSALFLGVSVSGVGDANGDGNADFIVGPGRANHPSRTDAGKAYVHSGADGALLYQVASGATGDLLGISVSGVGDVNGDAKGDFIVGAYYYDAPDKADAGKASVYSGADGALLYEVTGDAAYGKFGVSVSGVGDVNGDSVPDFIVGADLASAPGIIFAGKVYVYSGADGTLLNQVTGDNAYSEFGSSVSGVGDVNGDGKADFIVGAYGADAFGETNVDSLVKTRFEQVPAI